MTLIRNEDDIAHALAGSAYHNRAMEAASRIYTETLWLSAGFVRNHIWDVLFKDGATTPLNDIDVIFFNPEQTDPAHEMNIKRQLEDIAPAYPWSVKNQARMHVKNGDPAYHSVDDAMCYWLETVTPVAIRKDRRNRHHLLAPLGIDDLLRGTCNPTPHAKSREERLQAYRARMKQKQWWTIWNGVTVNGL